MRETIAGLKAQNSRLQETIEAQDRHLKQLEDSLVTRDRKLMEIQLEGGKLSASISKKFERDNLRLAARLDAVTWALYMAQMVTRSTQEKLDKCEALIGATGDKLSIAG